MLALGITVLVVLAACGPATVTQPASKAVGAVQTLDPATENNAQWKTLQMGQKGSGADQFTPPSGVAVDRQGNVYVSDTGNMRVMRLARR